MQICELMLVCACSSLNMEFPWWMWILAAWDVLNRISGDYKEWETQKFQKMQQQIPELQKIQDELLEKANAKTKELQELERKIAKEIGNLNKVDELLGNVKILNDYFNSFKKQRPGQQEPEPEEEEEHDLKFSDLEPPAGN